MSKLDRERVPSGELAGAACSTHWWRTMPGPFEGVRVADLTEGVGGPLAAMLLADFGAEVCKVERPAGDRLRGSAAFHVLNRGKTGVVADPARAEDRARLHALLAGADVALVPGPDPSSWSGGLDIDELRAANPGLVLAHVPLYGTDGPLAGVPEHETLLAALTGMACQQASYEPGPVYFTMPVAGYAHGVLTAVAVAAALVDRERTGAGQVVEVSGLRAAHEYQVSSLVVPSAMPKIVPPVPPVRTLFPTVGYYQGSDGEWFYLGALTAGQWVNLTQTLGLEELLVDPRYVDGPMSVVEREPFVALVERLEATFATQPRAHWLRVLHDEADVPVAPVNPREALFAEEQVRHLGLAAAVDDAEVGPTTQIGQVVFFRATPGAVGAGAPRFDRSAPWPEWSPRPAPDARPRPPGRGPLDGVVVLDAGSFVAGPFAATLLGDLGADVIKVEPPTGEPWRPFALGFLGCNRNKRSVVLDLKRSADRATFHELVARADIVVHNVRPTIAAQLGLDPSDLAGANPRVVSVAVSANGSSGPMVDDPAYDQVFQARSGMSRQQGGGDEPVIISNPAIDFTTASLGAFAGLAGLYARGATGRGQHAETSLLQGSLLLGAGELVFYDGRRPLVTGGRDVRGRTALDRAYRCRDDRWVHVQVTDAQSWAALAKALDRPEWPERWPWEAAAAEGRDGPLADALASAFAGRDRDATVAAVLDAGTACMPCVEVEEVFSHPHLAANAPPVRVQSAMFGTVTMPGTFAVFSETPVRTEYRTPDLGAHTDEVLAEKGVRRAGM